MVTPKNSSTDRPFIDRAAHLPDFGRRLTAETRLTSTKPNAPTTNDVMVARKLRRGICNDCEVTDRADPRYGEQRGWRNLKLYSDTSGEYTRDYVSAEDADMPAYNVFTRRDGLIRLFWSSEGGPETADPGQDPHDAPDMSPLWTILDTTPEGCGNPLSDLIGAGFYRVQRPYADNRT